MRAKTVWVAHLDDYHLLGLKFVRPLSTDGNTRSRQAVEESSYRSVK